MTYSGTADSACPICDTPSVYTNGHGACSLRCAIQVTMKRHREFSLPLDVAIQLVSHEYRTNGLPEEPTPEDKFRYKYVKVHPRWTSHYWSIDRALLLEAGVNVEYTWVGQGPNRSRVYRFSSSAIRNLPELMGDYKVRSFSEDDMSYLVASQETYWHFLSAP